ncbi:MAG: hypothetical protein P1P84_03805 [Deferrisomatales bacterium]|nr:hypothetical protein [Deferrisomatales bacterium]
MRTQPRIEDYHRRRQRLARRRRCSGSTRLRRLSLARPLEALPPCRFHNGLDSEFHDALRELARRAYAYPAVTALLLLCRGDQILIRIVAERPMTRPLRMLSRAWRAELGEAHPGIVWSLEVTDQPPLPGQEYQCLYWCQH